MTLHRIRSGVLLLVGIVFLSALLPGPLSAQDEPRGSRYLSLDHPAFEAVRKLRERGYLAELNPLSQPYTRGEIAAGLSGIEDAELSAPERHWVSLLRREMDRELSLLAGEDAPAVGGQFMIGGVASSSRRQDPMLPYREREGTEAWLNYAFGGWGELGRYAIEIRLFHDIWLEASGYGDPDGLDPGGIAVFNRTDNAYLSAQYSHGSLFVGRMRRNWAPLGSTGLMLSDIATTYPQVGFDIGGGGLELEFMLGELDVLKDAEGADFKRWIVANRLSYRRDDFAISVGEAKVFAMQGNGPGLRNLNPVELYFFDDDGRPQDFSANLVLDGQIWLRRGNLVLFGEGLLDDIDVSPGERDPEPFTYAMSFGGRLNSVRPWMDLGLDYRRVSAFAYRSRPTDTWSFMDRGLGDNWADYDRLTLTASLFPAIPGLRLSPVLAYQRKGEGDFRTPLPPREEHLASPSIFLGVLEKTARVALRGHYQPNPLFSLEWDAGVNFVRDAGHEVGESLSEFSWVLRLKYLLDRGFD